VKGDLATILATLCWSAANVAIARGAGGKGDDNGAFLSILMTTVIGAGIWLALNFNEGWARLNGTALLWFGLAGALTIYIGRVFYHSSIQYLGALRSSSVKRVTPLFAVILAVTLLGEHLSVPMVIGMVLIFSGLGVLVHEAMSTRGSADSVVRIESGGLIGRWINLGIIYGVVSALAYAGGNVARKFGLIHMPDAAFGTMFGAAVGAILFLLTAMVVQSYRHAVVSTFTRFNPWLFTASILATVGQLMFFIAIDLTSVSRASLIMSTEVFVTMLLMMLVFRNREKLTRSAVIAASLGVLGAAIIILNE